MAPEEVLALWECVFSLCFYLDEAASQSHRPCEAAHTTVSYGITLRGSRWATLVSLLYCGGTRPALLFLVRDSECQGDNPCPCRQSWGEAGSSQWLEAGRSRRDPRGPSGGCGHHSSGPTVLEVPRSPVSSLHCPGLRNHPEEGGARHTPQSLLANVRSTDGSRAAVTPAAQLPCVDAILGGCREPLLQPAASASCGHPGGPARVCHDALRYLPNPPSRQDSGHGHGQRAHLTGTGGDSRVAGRTSGYVGAGFESPATAGRTKSFPSSGTMLGFSPAWSFALWESSGSSRAVQAPSPSKALAAKKKKKAFSERTQWSLPSLNSPLLQCQPCC